MTIIAIVGKAGSGKDTVFDMIKQRVPATAHIAFAEPLKDGFMLLLGDAYNVPHDAVFGPSHLRMSQVGNLVRDDGSPLTVRHCLQTLGTEWGRDLLYTNVWADLGVQRARNAIRGGNRIAAITDCRFINEMQAVRSADGHVWRLERPGAGLDGDAAVHPSEAELASDEARALATATITNTGTLDELRLTVADLLATHGLA